MNDQELDNLVGYIFKDVDDIKICLRQLQETMNVDDKLYYQIKDFLYELDIIDRLVLDYSLSNFKSK
tara:strand:+ start:251 stop:451 length:201 start_codon:yes stop_codon:yes gene_type:complete